MGARSHACGQKLRGDSITASTALSHTTAQLRQSPRELLQDTNRTSHNISFFYTVITLANNFKKDTKDRKLHQSHQTNHLNNTRASGVD